MVRVMRALGVAMLLAAGPMWISACGGSDGDECSTCESSSDCGDGLVCRESTLGQRCFNSGSSSCDLDLNPF